MIRGARVVTWQSFYAAMHNPRFLRFSALSGALEGVVLVTLEAPEKGFNVEMVAHGLAQRSYEGWWF